MTTPLNFILDPAGTERAVKLRSRVVCVFVGVVTCPKTVGAIDTKTARTQPTASFLKLIVFAPSILNGNAQRGTFQQRLKCRVTLEGGPKRVAKQTPKLKGVTKLEQCALARV